VTFADYTIEHSDVDWSELLESWAWLLPPEFTVWIMNRFGELFLVFDDGSVHWLEVGAGELKRVADDRDHFAQLADDHDNANDWLMIPLVEKLVAAGILPGEGECYAHIKLPILGGDYTVENTHIVQIVHYFRALGPIHERLSELPDGTGVVFPRLALRLPR
jgi:hypothetical protein